MSEYIVKMSLVVNGEEETNFSEFTENEVVHGKVVQLMNKSGFGEITERYGFMLKYVVPTVGARDWGKVKNAVVTVQFDDGITIIFRGSYALSTGSGTANGADEITKDITFFATDRKES